MKTYLQSSRKQLISLGLGVATTSVLVIPIFTSALTLGSRNFLLFVVLFVLAIVAFSLSTFSLLTPRFRILGGFLFILCMILFGGVFAAIGYVKTSNQPLQLTPTKR